MANIKTKRLFISLDPPEPIKFEINKALKNFKTDNIGVRWVKKASLHMTLCFLGTISLNKEEAVKQIMKELSNTVGSVRFLTGCLDAFPSMSRPKILYIKNIQTAGKDIKNFQQKLVNKLTEKIGFAQDARGWKPHITIGRVKNSCLYRSKEFVIKKLDYQIKSFELMEAHLLPSGSEYSQITSYVL